MKRVNIDVKEFIINGGPKPKNNMIGNWVFRINNDMIINCNGNYKDVTHNLKLKYQNISLLKESKVYGEENYRQVYDPSKMIKTDICSVF